MGEQEHEALANAYSILGLGIIPKGGLLKSSSSLFHKVSLSLADLADPTWAGNKTDRKLLLLNLNNNYRTKFCQLVDSLHKRFPRMINSVNKSWLVQAGGPRVVKCLLQMSTVVLYLTLEQSPTHSHLIHTDPAEITMKTEEIVTDSCRKMSQINSYTQNAEEIILLYKSNCEDIEQELKRKRDILNLFVEKLHPSFPDRSSDIKELLYLYDVPRILKEWKSEIDNRITELEKRRMFLEEKKNKFSQCMDKSKMVIKRRIEKRSDEFTLEFNAEKDCIRLPSEFFKDNLSAMQLLPLKNIQNEQSILNFPNFIKSYAVLISHVMQESTPIHNLESAIEIINDRLSYIQIVNEQSKNIQNELYIFFKQLKEEAQLMNNSNLILNDTRMSHLNVPVKFQFNMTIDKIGNSNNKYWDKIKENLILENLTFPVKEVNGYKISGNTAIDFHKQTNSKISIKITEPKSSIEGKFKKPSFIANLEETKNNMNMLMSQTLDRTARLNNTRSTIFNSTYKSKMTFSEHDHIVKLLTVEKKYPSEDSFVKSKNKSTKKWMSLFDETSVLEKSQSSPNLHEDSSFVAKSDIRISGIKAIDYSSFLFGMTSAPDSVQGSSKIEENSSASKIDIDGSSISKQSKEENPFKTPEKVPKKSSRKSIDRLINTYRKFKETRLKDLDTTKVIEETVDKKTHNRDSFMTNLQLNETQNGH